MLGAGTAWGRCACHDCHPAPGAKVSERRRQRARETRAWKRATERMGR